MSLPTIVAQEGTSLTAQDLAFSSDEPLFRVIRWCTALLGLDYRNWKDECLDSSLQVDGLFINRLSDSSPLPNQRVIKLDVSRTRASVKLFQLPVIQVVIEWAVTKFCVENKVSYRQGLNEVCAIFVDLMAEVIVSESSDLGVDFSKCDAHWLLCYNLFSCFTRRVLLWFHEDDSFLVLQRCLAMQQVLVQYHCPSLCKRLTEAGLSPELYATPWYVTGFSSKADFDAAREMWDVLIHSDSQFDFQAQSTPQVQTGHQGPGLGVQSSERNSTPVTYLLFLSVSLTVEVSKGLSTRESWSSLPECLTRKAYLTRESVGPVVRRAVSMMSNTPASLLEETVAILGRPMYLSSTFSGVVPTYGSSEAKSPSGRLGPGSSGRSGSVSGGLYSDGAGGPNAQAPLTLPPLTKVSDLIQNSRIQGTRELGKNSQNGKQPVYVLLDTARELLCISGSDDSYSESRGDKSFKFNFASGGNGSGNGNGNGNGGVSVPRLPGNLNETGYLESRTNSPSEGPTIKVVPFNLVALVAGNRGQFPVLQALNLVGSIVDVEPSEPVPKWDLNVHIVLVPLCDLSAAFSPDVTSTAQTGSGTQGKGAGTHLQSLIPVSLSKLRPETREPSSTAAKDWLTTMSRRNLQLTWALYNALVHHGTVPRVSLLAGGWVSLHQAALSDAVSSVSIPKTLSLRGHSRASCLFCATQSCEPETVSGHAAEYSYSPSSKSSAFVPPSLPGNMISVLNWPVPYVAQIYPESLLLCSEAVAVTQLCVSQADREGLVGSSSPHLTRSQSRASMDEETCVSTGLNYGSYLSLFGRSFCVVLNSATSTVQVLSSVDPHAIVEALHKVGQDKRAMSDKSTHTDKSALNDKTLMDPCRRVDCGLLANLPIKYLERVTYKTENPPKLTFLFKASNTQGSEEVPKVPNLSSDAQPDSSEQNVMVYLSVSLSDASSRKAAESFVQECATRFRAIKKSMAPATDEKLSATPTRPKSDITSHRSPEKPLIKSRLTAPLSRLTRLVPMSRGQPDPP